jgi:hypothetical protein
VARLDRLYHRIQTVSNDTVTDRGPRRLAAGYTESRWPGLGARALANRVGLPQPVIEPDGQLGWLRQALATQGTHGRRTWRSQRRYRIAVNAAYRQVRRRGRRQREVSWDNLPPDLEPASGDDPAEQTELRTVLMAAIDELGAADHTVVVPRDVDGMSHLDIAATLDLRVPAVKARVHRVHLLLRRRLRDYLEDISKRTQPDRGPLDPAGRGDRGNRLYGTLRLLRGQAELLQLRIEPHPGQPERGRRRRLVALGLREGIRDRTSFELLKGRRRILSRDA